MNLNFVQHILPTFITIPGANDHFIFTVIHWQFRQKIETNDQFVIV